MSIRCTICPKGCELEAGDIGDCRVRQNLAGTIHCLTYNHPCSINIDPVEKKPLYHFLPGSPVFSLGTAGCNLHCKQCQNWPISQSNHSTTQTVRPIEIAEAAINKKCPAIAYTYTEPLVSYEYTLDCCRSAVELGIKNILVTAGYINPDPLRKICRYIDAANVDLKAFSDSFYQDVCDARLTPVLMTLKIMKECGVMLEITNLIIPTLNDQEGEIRNMCSWIAENLGPEVPLHFSRFFPQHRLQYLPATPESTLLRAREIALESGLQFVYVGNMNHREGECTFCPDCKTLLIDRSGYQIKENRIEQGSCPECGVAVYGIWD